MSYWTRIQGTIQVRPMGRTQHEKEYILKTVLDHLPLVTGSEDDMQVDIVCRNDGYHTSSRPFDEFGEITNNLKNIYGCHDRIKGQLKLRESYLLVVYGIFRDRKLEQTYKEFIKWLCRLAKRIEVEDVLVKIDDYDKSKIIMNDELKNSYDTKFGQMYETGNFKDLKNELGDEINWCEYLLYPKAKNSDYPMLLAYKYFNDEENDKEVERRYRYSNS